MGGRQVRLGTVWDRGVEVMRGRAGILTMLALGFIILPSVVASAIVLFGGADTLARTLGNVTGIAARLLLLAGALAITAVASDPRVGAGQGAAIGLHRLPPALGLVVLVAVAAMLLILPIAFLTFSAGATFNAATGRIDVSRANGGGVALAGLLSLLGALAGLWITAKLAPLFAVVVNERRGIRAFARSFALTRGATLRLMGVLILYGILLTVVNVAAVNVTGVVARLLLGSEATATVAMIVTVVNVTVTAIASVVQSVFLAQYYLAARDDEDAGETATEAGAMRG